MKKFTKILILAVAIMTMIGGFAPKAFATPTIPVTPLSVQFSPNPLFEKPNFLPLDETSGTVTVTNGGSASQIILTEAINVLDNDNFGSLLHLKIMEGSTTLYDNSLSHFFSTTGEYSLGAIINGTSRTFTYTISFINSSDNSYQGKTLGFDVCVGFLGGETHCGDTVINGEDGGDTGGGSIHGSSGSSTSLIIFGEQANNISNVDLSGTVAITWNTNKLATSQVIYGPVSGGPYSLDLYAPNFGYPFSTPENSVKVTNHLMNLIGLNPGETYVYRVVSRASPATVSYEHHFVVLDNHNLLALNNHIDNNTNNNGQVLGAPIDQLNLGELDIDQNIENLNNQGDNLLGASAGKIMGIPNFWFLSLLVLLLFLIILIVKIICRRKKNKKEIQTK